MNNYDPAILDKREIVIKKLFILKDNKCVLGANLGKNESLPVTIVAINLESSILILKPTKNVPPILNGSTLEQLQKKMITVPRVEFSTVLNDVQAAFTVESVKKITFKGNHAFQVYIPGSLHWQNRRKHYRKKIPIANSSFCEIVLTVPVSDAPPDYKQHYEAATTKIRNDLTKQKWGSVAAIPKEQSINSIRLNLYDVSLSGCSMLNRDEEFSYFLNKHTVYENCKIVMPDNNEIRVSFEIMLRRTIESDDVEAFNELIGIRFLDIKRDVI